MSLSRQDLEYISAGSFSKLSQWSSTNMDPNRVIIPAPPYLFMHDVLEIDKDYIRYRCHPFQNSLLQPLDVLPAGIALEFFQGYMILADWMGYSTLPKNVEKRIHRALGGKFEYVNDLPSIQEPLDIELHITKVTKFGKTTITQYQGQMLCQDKVIIRIKDFSGIFYEQGAIKSLHTQYVKQSGLPIKSLSYSGHGLMHTFDRIDVYDDFYIEGIRAIHPDEWFFKCHFVHDPCMPGSFLFQSFFDIMTKYLGYPAHPVCNQEIISAAKLHVLPNNQQLRLCIKISDKSDTRLNCNYSIYVDDMLAFTCENIGIRLQPLPN